MTMNETLTMTALMLAPAFFSLLGMGALGSPAVAVLGEMAAKTKKRVFFDKYGQQTASMGMVLLILLLIIEAGAIGLIYTKYPNLVQQYLDPASPFMNSIMVALGASAVFIILGFAYMLTWKAMKKAKGLHMALGLFASTAALTMVAIAVPIKLLIGLPHEAVQAQLALGFKSMVVPMATMYSIFLVVAAAGLSCAYLVMRRNKDDFGRDYYNFTLKLAARWSVTPMIAFLACQGWLFVVLPDNFKALVMETPLGIVWCIGIVLGLVCTVIWALIARNESPLRMKGLTFLNVALMWLMHTMNVTLFMNFMSMF